MSRGALTVRCFCRRGGGAGGRRRSPKGAAAAGGLAWSLRFLWFLWLLWFLLFLKFSTEWWFSDSGDFAYVFPTILRRCGGACRDEVAPFRSYIILLRYRGGAAASIVEARKIIVPGPRVQMGRPRLATPLCTPSKHLPGDPPDGDLFPGPSRKFRAILHLPLTFFRTPPPRPALFLHHTHSASFA